MGRTIVERDKGDDASFPPPPYSSTPIIPPSPAEAEAQTQAPHPPPFPPFTASSSAGPDKPTKHPEYPKPLVYEPLHQPHLQTLIILHGRGSNAHNFALPFLSTPAKISEPEQNPKHEENVPSPSCRSDHSLSSSAAAAAARISTTNTSTIGNAPQDQNRSIQSLHTLLPHTRFVFPTARPLRAKLYKRRQIHQWFDAWRLPFQPDYVRKEHGASHEEEKEEEGGRTDAFRKSDAEVEREKQASQHDDIGWENEDLQAPGLRETSLYLSDLVEMEHALLHSQSQSPSPSASAPSSSSPNTNPNKSRTDQKRTLILGGLSQGAAAALTAVLACPEMREKVDGVFGLCGYLPFADTLKLTVDMGGVGDEDDDDGIFEREDGEGPSSISAVDTATDTLREILGLPPLSSSSPLPPTSNAPPTLSSPISRTTVPLPPIFLAHGTHDAKVDIRLARAARRCVEALTVDVGVNVGTEVDVNVKGKREGKVDLEWYDEWGLGHWYSEEMLGRLVAWIQRVSSRTEEGC